MGYLSIRVSKQAKEPGPSSVRKKKTRVSLHVTVEPLDANPSLPPQSVPSSSSYGQEEQPMRVVICSLQKRKDFSRLLYTICFFFLKSPPLSFLLGYISLSPHFDRSPVIDSSTFFFFILLAQAVATASCRIFSGWPTTLYGTRCTMPPVLGS